MNWGLLILYALFLMATGLELERHGKPKEGTHNFWIHLISGIIQLVLIWWAVGWKFF